MSLNLYNKILSIIEENNFSENTPQTTGKNIVVADSTEKMEGGVAMIETMENLVGGSVQENTPQTTGGNIVVADSTEKMEGGAKKKNKKKTIKEIDEPPTEKKINENLFEGGCKSKYSDFLRRLNTTELFHENNNQEKIRNNNSHEKQFEIAGGNSTTDIIESVSGGENDENVLEVLPMFPYLIRY